MRKSKNKMRPDRGITFKYLELKTWEGRGVVKRLDVTEKTDNGITAIENGMNMNLNHEKYYTFCHYSKVELETI